MDISRSNTVPTLYTQPITPAAFAPYGWMLGKPFPIDPAIPAFTNPATDFWREHIFDPGQDGEPEILWVNYRNAGNVSQLEKHLRTQQAIVPLTGSIIHIVARGAADGSPDLSTLSAFMVRPGQGLCMAPDCWHASRVQSAEVTCLMLTRRSTTMDLVGMMKNVQAAQESELVDVPTIDLVC